MSTDHKQGADASTAVREALRELVVTRDLLIQLVSGAPEDPPQVEITITDLSERLKRGWERARAALAAAAPADAGESRVPAGFKLVPMKPTAPMLNAAFDLFELSPPPGYATGMEARKAIYAAMLAAAPEAPTAPLPAAEEVGRWLPMETAPLDGTLVRLLVKFDNHGIEDTNEPTATIGSHNDGEWNFVGWDWHCDEWARGSGDLLGWLPMAPTTLPPGEPKP